MKNVNLILLLFLLISCSSKSVIEQKDEDIENECPYFYIPFELNNESIIVTMNIKNVGDVRFLVDNGCQNVVFLDDFIQKNQDTLNLKLYSKFYSLGKYGLNPEQKSYIAAGNIVFFFKDTIFKNINSNIYFENKKNIGSYVEVLVDGPIYLNLKQDNIVGILPLKILAQKGLLKLNFQDKCIEFPDTLDKKGLVSYDYIIENGIQYIHFPIQLNGEQIEYFVCNTTFDLGNPGNLLIVMNNKTKELKKYTSKNYVTIFQNVDYNSVFFPTIQIGKDQMKINDLLASFVQTIDEHMELNIGIGILSEYTLYFDYKNNKIYTYSDKKEVDFRDTTIYLPVVLTTSFPGKIDCQYYISGIIDTTDMLLKLRDTIISINNIKLSGLKADSISKLLKGNKTGKNSITIKRNGKQMTLFDVKRKRK